jgi:peptidase A4-like protein
MASATPTSSISPITSISPTATPVASIVPGPEATASAFDGLEHCSGVLSVGTGDSLRAASTWAGYVAAEPPGAVSCVEASWIEPTVACGPLSSAVHIWVGIGAYDSVHLGIEDKGHPIQQAGTGVECEDGQAEHYAWHQFLPRESTDHPFPAPAGGGDMVIEPGDGIWAQVRYTGEAFVMTVANLGTGDVRSISQTGAGRYRSSAEWIVSGEGDEPIARFSSVTFTGGQATLGGSVGPIGAAAWDRNRIDEWTGDVLRLRVSGLSAEGDSFRVVWVSR